MENVSPIKRQSLASLLQALRECSPKSPESRKVWSVFDHDVQSYIWKICYNISSVSINFDEDEIKDLISEIKYKIYDCLYGFEFLPDDSDSLKSNKFKSWLTKIARHSCFQKLAERADRNNIFVRLEETLEKTLHEADEEEQNKALNLKPLKKELNTYLSTLKPRDREIFKAYAYHRNEKGKIPTEMLHRLEVKYNLKDKHATKIYNRTLVKVQKHFKSPQYGRSEQYDTGDTGEPS